MMQIRIDHSLLVTKEPADRRYCTESNFLHAIKVKLQEMGYDVIKKRMWKDGHMVSDYCQYIRSRLTSDKRFFGIWDDRYAVRMLHEDWNKYGEVSLAIAGVENCKPTLPMEVRSRRDDVSAM